MDSRNIYEVVSTDHPYVHPGATNTSQQITAQLIPESAPEHDVDMSWDGGYDELLRIPTIFAQGSEEWAYLEAA